MGARKRARAGERASKRECRRERQKNKPNTHKQEKGTEERGVALTLSHARERVRACSFDGKRTIDGARELSRFAENQAGRNVRIYYNYTTAKQKKQC